ncbi:hypothetical protein [Metaclostridioides mangenotii]|uniref:hypothetical protein n=1 Tax=Metaclostridioides mangenotii TaxID=1540 RepID=UPI0004653EC7|nr:hypothetical protein [Clostridioides mangenotii]
MENSVLVLIVSLEVFVLGFYAGKLKDYIDRERFNKNYDNMTYKIKILERDNQHLKNKLLLKDRTF